MQIILLTKGKKKTINFSAIQQKVTYGLLGSFVLLLAVYWYMPSVTEVRLTEQSGKVSQELLTQRIELERVREKTQNTLDNLALRVGQMQAQLTRLNAVGEHLVKKANLTASEFNFDELPAIGSAGLPDSAESFTENQLLHDIQVLDKQLSLREKQLTLLGVFSANKELSKEVRPAGLPVAKGWLSSYYGYRADPFTGKKKFHHGVDIAGKTGTSVLAAASGLVTYAGKKGGYGYLIEIDHGSGYVTRYGHNKEIVVKLGDVVKQNDVIAKMGSTGHSTGPHVHFEVMRNGKKVNPRKYLYSSS
ncbi:MULTISPECIES: M23 family metallopeptidase [Cycloclasticus]|uniref:Peptidase M23B n=1 Tax=Cycloclasticus pugetii TaxID=34068 RepID=A0AB33YZ82_9GAMM|nr:MULTISPECIES: M23 family metallopeptidase [Cycloclasticus]ATI04009.1 M23 family peptidase [Cycloclasticus sp. PY97N]EPD12228.1 peptidase M23B [Cycloclasticus pugetii]